MKDIKTPSGWLFFWWLMMCLLGVGLYGYYIRSAPPPVTAQQLADKLCQELYGPQVGATWVEDKLMCESVRGELIEIRRVK